jgi:hypothetical protein
VTPQFIIGLPYDHPYPSGIQQFAYKGLWLLGDGQQTANVHTHTSNRMIYMYTYTIINDAHTHTQCDRNYNTNTFPHASITMGIHIIVYSKTCISTSLKVRIMQIFLLPPRPKKNPSYKLHSDIKKSQNSFHAIVNCSLGIVSRDLSELCEQQCFFWNIKHMIITRTKETE